MLVNIIKTKFNQLFGSRSLLNLSLFTDVT